MGALTAKPSSTSPVTLVPTHACISALETLYPRVCARLVQMWFRDGIDAYLDGLILDDRFDRQGFPIEVIDELLFLSELRWTLCHQHRVAEVSHRDGDDFTFQTHGPLVSSGRSNRLPSASTVSGS